MSPVSSRRLAPCLLSALLCLAACSTTDKPKSAGNPVGADGLPVLTDEQKEAGVVCKYEVVTGSRISRKICTTPAQREREQAMGREQTEEIQRRNTGPTIFGQ